MLQLEGHRAICSNVQWLHHRWWCFLASCALRSWFSNDGLDKPSSEMGPWTQTRAQCLAQVKHNKSPDHANTSTPWWAQVEFLSALLITGYGRRLVGGHATLNHACLCGSLFLHEPAPLHCRQGDRSSLSSSCRTPFRHNGYHSSTVTAHWNHCRASPKSSIEGRSSPCKRIKYNHCPHDPLLPAWPLRPAALASCCRIFGPRRHE